MSYLQKFIDQERMHFEGERGVKDLETLCETLDYGKGFMRGRAIEDFLADNPGAQQALVLFIEDWTERNSEWDEKFSLEVIEG